MTKLSIKMNGREIQPDQLEHEFTNTLERAAVQGVVDVVESRAGTIRCPVHGEAAIVTLTVKNGNELTFNVKGCCRDLVDLVATAINSPETGSSQ